MKDEGLARPGPWRRGDGPPGTVRRDRTVAATALVGALALGAAFAVREAWSEEAEPLAALLWVALPVGAALLLAVFVPWTPPARPRWREVPDGVRFVARGRLDLLLATLLVLAVVLLATALVRWFGVGLAATGPPWWGLVGLGCLLLIGWALIAMGQVPSAVVISRRGIDLEQLAGLVSTAEGRVAPGATSYSLSWIRLEHVVAVEGGAAVLDAGRSSVRFHPADYAREPARLLRLLQHYHRNPQDRLELGTPAARRRWSQV